jgi:hypothetical protein
MTCKVENQVLERLHVQLSFKMIRCKASFADDVNEYDIFWHRLSLYSNLKADQKILFLVMFKGQNLLMFTRKMMFHDRNKLNEQNFELCGPNKKLLRATFDPRAVCCACLFWSQCSWLIFLLYFSIFSLLFFIIIIIIKNIILLYYNYKLFLFMIILTFS